MITSEWALWAGPCAKDCLSQSCLPCCKVDTMISPTLQMRNLSLREVKQFSQGHTDNMTIFCLTLTYVLLTTSSPAWKYLPGQNGACKGWELDCPLQPGNLQTSGEQSRCPGFIFQGGGSNFFDQLALSPACPVPQSPKRARLVATCPDS